MVWRELMALRFVALFLLVLTGILTASSAALAAPPRQDGLTPEQWRADLKYLAEQLRTRHPNPFYKTPEAEFDRAVAALDKAIPTMLPDDIVAGLIRISAMIDGHTLMPFWQSGVN